MTSPLNLNTVQFFEAVARLGRISAAADELRVSPSAVSQQIRTLEEQLGVRMFRREKRRLFLTQEGERLYQATALALGMIRDARTAVMRQREPRRLIMRASPSFAVRWLAPRLKEFVDLHSSWDLRIDAAPDFIDFGKETADLEIRYGIGDWAGLHEEQVLSDLMLPLCSPDYLAMLRETSDDPVRQLHAGRLIDSVKALLRWDRWLAWQGISGIDIETPFQFDRSSMSIQFAVDGGGVALESAALALPEMRSGRLVPLSSAYPVADLPAYWLVCPPRHLHRRGVRALRDWLLLAARRHDETSRAFLAEIGCITATPPEWGGIVEP